MAGEYDESVAISTGDDSDSSSYTDDDSHDVPHDPEPDPFMNARPPTFSNRADQGPRPSTSANALLQTPNHGPPMSARLRQILSRSGLEVAGPTQMETEDMFQSSCTDSSLLEDEDHSESFPQLYTEFIQSAFQDSVPPYNVYSAPPLHDEEEMKEYLKTKAVWEMQIDMRRSQLGEFVQKNHMKPGVHSSTASVYNPADYAHLKVNREIKELFQYIEEPLKFLKTLDGSKEVREEAIMMKPFLPEYYPSVGDIDAFLKVVEPSVADVDVGLGLNSLDEPSIFQSDPALLDLHLKSFAKFESAKRITVKKVENPNENSHLITKWINDITELHRSKPSPTVHYSMPMPDLDSLMQEWSPGMEEQLRNKKIPGPEFNCDLTTYVDLVCGLLDIPVYKSRIESLHVLFNLADSCKELQTAIGMMDLRGLGDASKFTADSEDSTLEKNEND